MKLEKLDLQLSICKLAPEARICLDGAFYFVGKTDQELSLVCSTDAVPEAVLARDDGWRAFRVQGMLDFSLTGVLSSLSGALAKNRIGIFAVSTYNTDYILVRQESFERALAVLEAEGHEVMGQRD